jgi:hypothetical protein
MYPLAGVVSGSLPNLVLLVGAFGLLLLGAGFEVDVVAARRDLSYFIVGYVLAVGAAFVRTRVVRLAIAAILVVLYLVYVRQTLASGELIEGEELDSLHLAGILVEGKRPFPAVGSRIVPIRYCVEKSWRLGWNPDYRFLLNSKRAPPSSPSVTQTSHPCTFAMSATIERPKLVWPPSALTPWSNTLSRFSGGIPLPLSST